MTKSMCRGNLVYFGLQNLKPDGRRSGVVMNALAVVGDIDLNENGSAVRYASAVIAA